MAGMELGSSVEQERLLALVDTQRQHIDELRTQLRETLEAQKQQKLQLVQQSPARRNVRKLLEQAAADNTTLANRVEELRAQRNALHVTKAALTAQVSELIRVAADERQREEQYRLLLHQLHQVCRLIQQPHLQKPEEQMAAVVAHIKQLYRERQELSEKLEAAMRSNSSCSGIKQQHPAALSTLDTAAAAPQPPLSSPTGLKLDQRATSQLIWTSSSCPSSLEGQGTGELSAQQGGERWGRSQDVRDAQCGSSGSSDTTGQPAVACDTGGCSESYNTAQSQLLDMSYISPLRGASSGDNALGRKIIRDDTPCSRAPASCAADSALASATEGAGTAASTGAVDAGTPLSAQSLSAFSAAKGPMPSPHMRDELQALSPLRRCGLPRATSHASAAAATSSGCSSAGSSGSSASRTTTGALADLLTPVGSGQQQQQTPVALSSAAVGSVPPGTACSRLTPKGSPLSAGCGFGSSVSVASSSKAGSVGPGLTLQPEFRLAAADALRPSPGAARDSSVLGIAAAGSAVSSHRLWLPEEQEGVGEAGELEGAAAALEGLYPRTLSQDFETGCLQDADDSCSSINDNEDDMMQAMHLGRKRQTGAGGELKRRSRGRAVLHGMLWVGVSVAAAGAGGAAAWRHKHAEVLQLMSLVRGGAAAAAGHAQQCVADGLRHVRHQTSRERSSNSSGHGSSMDTGEVAVAAS